MRRPEIVAARVARPLAFLSRATAPAVLLLGWSSAVVLRLFGAPPRRRWRTITEEELSEGAAGGGRGNRRAGKRGA